MAFVPGSRRYERRRRSIPNSKMKRPSSLADKKRPSLIFLMPNSSWAYVFITVSLYIILLSERRKNSNHLPIRSSVSRCHSSSLNIAGHSAEMNLIRSFRWIPLCRHRSNGWGSGQVRSEWIWRWRKGISYCSFCRLEPNRRFQDHTRKSRLFRPNCILT